MSILSQVLYNPKSRLDCFDKKFGPKIENASKKLVKVQYKVADYMWECSILASYQREDKKCYITSSFCLKCCKSTIT